MQLKLSFSSLGGTTVLACYTRGDSGSTLYIPVRVDDLYYAAEAALVFGVLLA